MYANPVDEAKYQGAYALTKKILEELEKANKLQKQEMFKREASNDIMGIFGGNPKAYDPKGPLQGMGGIEHPLTPSPIVPGPGVAPGAGIGSI